MSSNISGKWVVLIYIINSKYEVLLIILIILNTSSQIEYKGDPDEVIQLTSI